MNRHFFITSPLLLISQAVYASPYIVGSIGGFQNDSNCNPGLISVAGVPDLIRCEKDSKAASIRIGYKWPAGPGIEASYLHTGDTKSHVYDDVVRFRTDMTYGVGTYVEQFQRQKNRTIALAATYTLNLSEKSHFVAKAGIARSNGKSTTAIVTNGPTPASIQTWEAFEHTRTRHYLGADLQRQLTPSTFISISLDLFTLGYNKVWPGSLGPNSEAVKAKMVTIGIGKNF